MNSFELKTKYKYIEFIEQPSLFGQSFYYVKNKRYGSILGNVEFYYDWHCFTFISNAGIVLDKVCLSDITDFLTQLDLLNNSQN